MVEGLLRDVEKAADLFYCMSTAERFRILIVLTFLVCNSCFGFGSTWLALFANLPKQTLAVPICPLCLAILVGGILEICRVAKIILAAQSSLAQDTHGPVFPCFSS